MKIRFRVPEAGDPRREAGLSLPAQESKRVPPRLRWLFITLLALSPAIWVAWHFADTWLWVEARGFVVFEEIAVTAPQDAYVRNLAVTPGSQVQRGAILLRLDDATLDAEARVLREAALPHAASELDAAAQAQVRQHQAATLGSLQQRRQGLSERSRIMRELVARGAATRGELLAAESEELAVTGDIQSLRETMVRDQPKAAPLPSTEQRARLADLEARLADLVIRAPVDGTADNLTVTAGQRVARGAPLLELRHGPPRVVAFLPERELGRIHTGETVRIQLPNRVTVKGRILGPAPSSLRVPDELAGPYDARTPRIQMLIEPDALPPETQLQRLPLTIRSFRFSR